MFKKVITTSLLLLTTYSFAAPFSFLPVVNNQESALTTAEAFPVDISSDNGFMGITIDVKPDYYLYKNKIKLTVNGEKTPIDLPEGIIKKDKFFGNETVIKYGFSSKINSNQNTEYYNIDLEMQGCSKKFKVCYPPETITKKIKNINYDKAKQTSDVIVKKENINNENNSVSDVIKKMSTTNNTNIIVDYLVQNKTNPLIYIVFFCLGVLIAFTPCIYPMMPIIIASTTKAKNVKLSALSYVIGMACCYSLLGLLTGFLNFNIQMAMQNSYFIYSIATILIILSLFMFGIINVLLPSSLNEKITKKINEINPSNYKNQFLIGFLSSLILSPCSVAPLLGVLIFINQMNEPLFGSLLLGILGMGIGFPLFLLATSFSRFMPKNGNWMNEVKNIIGMIILFIALYLLKRYIDPVYIYVIGSYALLIYGINLMDMIIINKKQLIGSLIIISSVIFLNFNISLVLSKSNNSTPKVETIVKNDIKLKYTEIHNTKELLDMIADTKKPIFIDYYADWCVTCVRMNAVVLSDDSVIDYMNKNYEFLKINLTDLTKEKKELMKNNNILAIPYYVFINKDKEEKIFTGELGKIEFLNLLKKYKED